MKNFALSTKKIKILLIDLKCVNSYFFRHLKHILFHTFPLTLTSIICLHMKRRATVFSGFNICSSEMLFINVKRSKSLFRRWCMKTTSKLFNLFSVTCFDLLAERFSYRAWTICSKMSRGASRRNVHTWKLTSYVTGIRLVIATMQVKWLPCISC